MNPLKRIRGNIAKERLGGGYERLFDWREAGEQTVLPGLLPQADTIPAAGGDLIAHHIVRQDKEASGADLAERIEPLFQAGIEGRAGRVELRARNALAYGQVTRWKRRGAAKIRRKRQRTSLRQCLEMRGDFEGFLLDREVIEARFDIPQQRLILAARTNDFDFNLPRRRPDQTRSRNSSDEMAPIHVNITTLHQSVKIRENGGRKG